MSEDTDALKRRIAELEATVELQRADLQLRDRAGVTNRAIKDVIEGGVRDAVRALDTAAWAYDQATLAILDEARLVHSFSHLMISKEFCYTNKDRFESPESRAAWESDVDRCVHQDIEWLRIAMVGADTPEEAVQRWLNYRAEQHAERIKEDQINSRVKIRTEDAIARMTWLMALMAGSLPKDHPLAPLSIYCPVCRSRPGEPCTEHLVENQRLMSEYKARMEANPYGWPEQVLRKMWMSRAANQYDTHTTVGEWTAEGRVFKFHEARIIWTQQEDPIRWLAVHGTVCPQCGAEPGEKCFNAKGTRAPHQRRFNEVSILSERSVSRYLRIGRGPVHDALVREIAVGDPLSDVFVIPDEKGETSDD